FVGTCARADSIAGQVTADAASMARAARRKRGDGITAGGLHLADRRPRRDRVDRARMACLAPTRNNCPDRTCPPTLMPGYGRYRDARVTYSGSSVRRRLRVEPR